MRYVITGAGQIGTQLARDLLSAGHNVTIVRRSAELPDGAEEAELVSGDAGDRDVLRAVVADSGADSDTDSVTESAAAVFHCIHSSYDSVAWRRDLPHREQAVMDVAAETGIPVIFPESVYAFGTAARSLTEPLIPDPVSPLGRVRAELLAARATHPARTLSIAAADLIGPTANPQTSVFLLLTINPAAQGRTVWTLGDPDHPRSVTTIPDLTAAMIAAAQRAEELAPHGDAVLTAPSLPPRSQRQIAAGAARDTGAREPRVLRIPWWVLRMAGKFSPLMRELRDQRYLWEAPAVIEPGALWPSVRS